MKQPWKDPRTLLGTAVRWSGVSAAIRFACARRRVTLVVYHDPRPEDLWRHLAYLCRHYTPITLDRLADALDGTAPWRALPDYPLVVTLDDGHAANARLGEVFAAFGVVPTIYLCSGIVGTGRAFWWQTEAARRLGAGTLKALPDAERRRRLAAAGFDEEAPVEPRQALSRPELTALAPLVRFGAHTRTHPILPRCEDVAAWDEIAGSKTEVEALVPGPCRHFAYPNGDHGPREIAYLQRAGFVTARTTEAGWNGPGTPALRLKGISISDDASVDWLVVQLTCLPDRLRRLRTALRGRRRPGRRASAPAGHGEAPAGVSATQPPRSW